LTVVVMTIFVRSTNAWTEHQTTGHGGGPILTVPTADLSTGALCLPQQAVCEVSGLTAGSHTIAMVNRGPGPVAVDGLVVR
jgi:hypothetical protein